METIDIPNNSTQDTSTSNQRRRPRIRQRHINGAAGTSTEPRENEAQNRQQRSRRPKKGDAGGQARTSPSNSWPGTEGPAEGSQKRDDHRPKHHQKSTKSRNNGMGASETKNEDHSQPPQPPSGPSRRGARFGARLTDPQPVPVARPRSKYRRHAAPSEPIGEDLTSRLIHDLRTPPYPDCPICFNPIHPAQTTWSCSPSTPVVRQPEDEGQEQQYCWTTFHVKCIGEWASTNVKAVADAWRARGDLHKKGDWRCPGCQAKREIVPSGYWCFCHSTSEPKPPRLATPHSCAGPCSRVRESGCGHPCPLECHPGPCPPCQVTTRLTCYCPQKKTTAFRCGERRGNLSCGGVCGRKLGCGNHTCQEICHDGPCPDCLVREQVKCWCGASTKDVECGEGEGIHCVDASGVSWTGRYGCELECQIHFDCGIHQCKQPCHSPHRPITCPRSPSVVTTCPCGTHPIARSTSGALPVTTPTTFSARASCTSPIPTCGSPCRKPLSGCDHACAASCHNGPCPPCSVPIVRPCRCGSTSRGVPCSTLSESTEILCDKPCMALRACGKHQCNRLCCPLAVLATSAKKGKKRAVVSAQEGVGEEQGGLHECDLVCGKLLSCGLHKCEERDHKGVCPPCLRSSFEEMVCYCGRTVFEPPIPCGTRLQCTHPCTRPALPCGHKSTHMCHEDPISCPPCPHLATKRCACGKKMVNNVKCSLETEKVSCGIVCGKLMDCGYHQCERLCHADDCGPCKAPCGKPRKLCLPSGQHLCTRPCHAPASCLEDEPCESLVTIFCSCGRLRQSVHCGRCTTAPSGRPQATIKCNNECAIAKRNARLADALGITAESREKALAVTYHDSLVAFARVNEKFLVIVEKAFHDFVTSQKKTQVLPHMPLERRKFVHDLAAVYRMDTEMVDQEPNRSVRLIRRIDTRVPAPLLSASVAASAPPTPSLGKLVDLRASSVPSWRVAATTPIPKPAISGWGSRPASVAPAPAPASDVSPQPSRLTVSASVTRASSPARPAPLPRQDVPTSPTAVPDSWEDDA